MPWTLVTGGAKRLGATLCLALASEGYDVVVHYHTSDQEAQQVALECQQRGVRAAIIQGDFSRPDTTRDFISRYCQAFGQTQQVIHNVGHYHTGSAAETPTELYAQLFQTNFLAPLAITQGVLDSLKMHKGSIIHLGTAGLGKGRTDIYSSAYTYTKASLLLLTQSLAKELGPWQVRVNMVSPGVLENSVDIPQPLPAHIPLGRLGQTLEVANVITFLLKPENSYITGQNIEVAGGCRL